MQFSKGGQQVVNHNLHNNTWLFIFSLSDFMFNQDEYCKYKGCRYAFLFAPMRSVTLEYVGGISVGLLKPCETGTIISHKVAGQPGEKVTRHLQVVHLVYVGVVVHKVVL